MNADAKKTALRMIPYGIYVLTADDGKGGIAAATVNWVTQTAFTPPLVVVGIKTDSGAYRIVRDSRIFALNMLGKDQKGVAFTFFKPSEVKDGKISGQAYRKGATGAPILTDAVAAVECRVKHHRRGRRPSRRRRRSGRGPSDEAACGPARRGDPGDEGSGRQRLLRRLTGRGGDRGRGSARERERRRPDADDEPARPAQRPELGDVRPPPARAGCCAARTARSAPSCSPAPAAPSAPAATSRRWPRPSTASNPTRSGSPTCAGGWRSARLLHEFAKPTIAMLHGPAAGAGLSLALACDLRIAGEDARLTTAFAKVGLSGDFGGHYFLTRLVGTAKARELYFTAPILTRARGAGPGHRPPRRRRQRACGRDRTPSPARSQRGRASRSAT